MVILTSKSGDNSLKFESWIVLMFGLQSRKIYDQYTGTPMYSEKLDSISFFMLLRTQKIIEHCGFELGNGSIFEKATGLYLEHP